MQMSKGYNQTHAKSLFISKSPVSFEVTVA